MAKDIDYSGPEKEYKPYIDDLNFTRSTSPYGNGYHDVDQLREDLEEMAEFTRYLYDLCVNEMQEYTLKIDTSNEELVNSHKMAYPDDNTPDSISFSEYIYNFSVSRTTSSLYVNRYYENKVRGLYGTNALDIAHIVRIFHSEVKRIQNFLDKYLGDIDDPSEFRTIESLQNWAQNAKALLTAIEQTYKTKGRTSIPGSELDQLDEDGARRFQGLFQSKLNVLNTYIHDGITELYKDYDSQADYFYNRVLGPSLSFNLKVSNNINSNLDLATAPILHQEAVMSKMHFNSKFETALADQVKRNNLLYDYVERILQNLVQRDTYQVYMRQLSSIGATLPNPFFLQVTEEPATLRNNNVLLGDFSQLTYDENAASDHNYLTNRDADDAHPQYLKRTGDLVTGDFEIFGDLRLNGQDLTSVFGTDSEGNVVVRSEYLDWANVSPGNTSGVVNEFTPDNLYIQDVRYLSDGSIEYTIGFEIENDNVQGYEFEIIEI